MDADAGVAVARYRHGRGSDRGQRHGVRVRRRRGLDADGAGHGVERAQSEPPRRRARQQLRPPHSRLAPRRAPGARCPDRQGVVVERHADHIVEPLQRIDHCQRPRLPRHVRWLPVLLRGEVMRIARTLLISGAAVVTGVALFAQGRNIGNEWPTALGDAQRTNWMRSDPNISAETLAKPGFELQWRAGLEGQRGLKPAVQGATANGVTLFTPLSIVTGTNDAIAIDND